MDPITLSMWIAIVTQIATTFAKLVELGNKMQAGQPITKEDLDALKTKSDATVAALEAAVAALPDDPTGE